MGERASAALLYSGAILWQYCTRCFVTHTRTSNKGVTYTTPRGHEGNEGCDLDEVRVSELSEWLHAKRVAQTKRGDTIGRE